MPRERDSLDPHLKVQLRIYTFRNHLGVYWLVVYVPLWKIILVIGMIIPNIWKNKKCSKPPTKCLWTVTPTRLPAWHSTSIYYLSILPDEGSNATGWNNAKQIHEPVMNHWQSTNQVYYVVYYCPSRWFHRWKILQHHIWILALIPSICQEHEKQLYSPQGAIWDLSDWSWNPGKKGNTLWSTFT